MIQIYVPWVFLLSQIKAVHVREVIVVSLYWSQQQCGHHVRLDNDCVDTMPA